MRCILNWSKESKTGTVPSNSLSSRYKVSIGEYLLGTLGDVAVDGILPVKNSFEERSIRIMWSSSSIPGGIVPFQLMFTKMFVYVTQ